MLVKKMLKKLGYLSMIGLFVVNFLVLTTNDTKAQKAQPCEVHYQTTICKGEYEHFGTPVYGSCCVATYGKGCRNIEPFAMKGNCWPH